MSASPSPELHAAVAEYRALEDQRAALHAQYEAQVAELDATQEPLRARIEAMARREQPNWGGKQSIVIEGLKLALRQHPPVLKLPKHQGESDNDCKARLGRKLFRMRGARKYVKLMLDGSAIKQAPDAIQQAIGVKVTEQPGLRFTIDFPRNR